MEIVESRDGNVVVLAPKGEWDADGSPAFRELAVRLVEQGHKCFAVDFSGVTFIDSSALACLVSLYKRVKPTLNGDVRLFAMRPEIRAVFEQTKLEKVFDIGITYVEIRSGLE